MAATTGPAIAAALSPDVSSVFWAEVEPAELLGSVVSVIVNLSVTVTVAGRVEEVVAFVVCTIGRVVEEVVVGVTPVSAGTSTRKKSRKNASVSDGCTMVRLCSLSAASAEGFWKKSWEYWARAPWVARKLTGVPPLRI